MENETILGMKVNPLTYGKAVSQIKSWLEEGGKSRFVSIAAVNNVVSALKEPQLMKIENEADMVTTDGMPLVWILRRRGYRDCSRVYGPTLMLQTLKMAESSGFPVFLYGCTEDILKALQERFRREFPRLQMAGAIAPPYRELTEEENQSYVQVIRSSGTRIVFVGLSTPKQEYWMHKNVGELKDTVLMGVGAAFLFHAGKVKQAPSWLQRLGLEWLFRLLCEPRRLWRRYVLGNSYFVWRLVKAGFIEG